MIKKAIKHIEHFIPVVAVVIIIEFFPQYFNIDFLNPIQNSIDNFNLTDMVFSSIRDPNLKSMDTNIVIVNIGSMSRAGIAREIEIINKYDPAVIGIDSFFKLRKDDSLDVPLINALSKIKHLVLAEKIVYDKQKNLFDSMITSHPDFAKFGVGGYANLVLDQNEYMTVRTISPKEPVNQDIRYFFPVQLVRYYNPSKVQTLLTREHRTEIVDFARNIDKYKVFDVIDIMKDTDSLKCIKGKIVLMGYLGPNLQTVVSEDNFYTPMNKLFLGKSFPDMYGLIIHANVISMILNETYFEQMPKVITKILEIAYLSIIIISLHLLRIKRPEWYEPFSIISTIGMMIAIFSLLIFVFNKFNYYIGTTYMLWGIVLLVPVYEGYQDSIKPLSKKYSTILINKFNRKHRSDPGNSENI